MGRKSSIFFFLLLLAAFTMSGQNIEQQKQRRDALERDMEILRKQLNNTSKLSEQAISSLNLIQTQKNYRQRLLRESDNEIRAYNVKIQGIKAEIARQQAALDTLQTHYDRLVMGAYKNRDVRIWYMYILSSDNVSQAFRRFGYFKSLSSQISDQARKIEQFQAELAQKKANLLSVKNQAQTVRDRRADEVEKLKADEASQKKLVSKLKKNKKAYQASLAAKQKEMNAINRQITMMLDQATGKKGAAKKRPPVDYKLAASFEKNKGKLPWPVDGPVTEHYGAYQNKELRLSLFNNGINIACEPGSVVTAVFDGVVSNIMIAPGYGQCILIQHGNYYTTYCKVKGACVKPGQKVTTGQEIGRVSTIMGKTQLYFLVWKKAYLDPEKWLRPSGF